MKQVIVMRKDLNMRKGKMCAQAAHASIASIFKTDVRLDTTYKSSVVPTNYQSEWLRTGMKKVVLGIESEEELLAIVKRAKLEMIPAHTVTDAGLTEFNAPTLTCAALGPWPDAELDQITGHLKLL